MTKVPNLFRNVPKKRIHAPRGSSRRFSARPACLSFISFARVIRGNKKTHQLFSGGFQNLVFSLYEDFESPPPRYLMTRAIGERQVPAWSCARNLLRGFGCGLTVISRTHYSWREKSQRKMGRV